MSSSLSGNRVEDVPYPLLQRCPRMESLNIQGNPLKTFHRDAFTNLPKLEKL